jgi:trehalose synthase
MREVSVRAVPLGRLAGLLTPERAALLEAVAERTKVLLAGRTVWNVNSTAHGGGVAELLQTLLAYGQGAGIDTRWFVLTGDERFFTVTKRLHNLLHGFPGDGAGLDQDDLHHYEKVLAHNLERWQHRVRSGDIVLLHDPQTIGMAGALQARGAHVVWRCHIGAEQANDHSERGWAFLRPFVEAADAWVFSRRAYAPAWLPAQRVWVIPPSLDPFSAKNAEMAGSAVRAALDRAGLVTRLTADGSLAYTGREGSRGAVRTHRDLLLDEDRPLPAAAVVVLQVSRWDRLKDMAGVLIGFAGQVHRFGDDVHLVLAGPDAGGVSDDPEGAQVLEECRALRAGLPAPQRARVHLCCLPMDDVPEGLAVLTECRAAWARLPDEIASRCHLVCLPMDDVDENAHLVNALQRHATLVVQKSLVEGYGLTVTEPMWKRRAVLASAVGGIKDQIEDGVSGVLLDDPDDLDRFADLAAELLKDPERRARIGAAAHERVADRLIGDRHLIRYAELFGALVTG